MNIGMIGLGKLGLPCALAMEAKGFKVFGFDSSEHVRQNIDNRVFPHKEDMVDGLLQKTQIAVVSVTEVIQACDLVFVAVQTPHDPAYEGVMELPADRKDFDYTFLIDAVKNIVQATNGKPIILSVISTVLPKTMRREILPLLSPNVTLVYNPYFIAMGTCIHDFLFPEMTIMGSDSQEAMDKLFHFYRRIHEAPIVQMKLEEAELTKVIYNTYISTKIAFANTLMEMAHKIGANCDRVVDALSKATDRIISPKYMRGGMGDGGGCHPRDNIAMSWLADELSLSFNMFEEIMQAREKQTEWLANLAENAVSGTSLPIMILGKSFKPESNITTGSPALLLQRLLRRKEFVVEMYDPFIDSEMPDLSKPACFIIGTKHQVFNTYTYPNGSIVIDPFRYILTQEGVTLISVGGSPACR